MFTAVLLSGQHIPVTGDGIGLGAVWARRFGELGLLQLRGCGNPTRSASP